MTYIVIKILASANINNIWKMYSYPKLRFLYSYSGHFLLILCCRSNYTIFICDHHIIAFCAQIGFIYIIIADVTYAQYRQQYTMSSCANERLYSSVSKLLRINSSVSKLLRIILKHRTVTSWIRSFSSPD